jgi:hypothetical protein
LQIQYTYFKQYKWCKSCQIDYLKNNCTNWTSRDKQIDYFNQDKQLNASDFIILEWIPYNQFIDIGEIKILLLKIF